MNAIVLSKTRVISACLVIGAILIASFILFQSKVTQGESSCNCTVINSYTSCTSNKIAGICMVQGTVAVFQGTSDEPCGGEPRTFSREEDQCGTNKCAKQACSGGGCSPDGTTCQRDASRCADSCGNEISCFQAPCVFITSVDLKFNNLNGPVNLDGSALGTLSWNIGSYNGTPACQASCVYTNTGEATPCAEFTGAKGINGTQQVTPKTSVRYSISCTNGNTVSDSVQVNVRRYRCLFSICQGSSRGTISSYKYPTKTECSSSCKSVIPEH